jgi:osmotically-inducible protein OsmY
VQEREMSDERGPDPQAMSDRDREIAAEVDRLLRDEAGVYAAVRVGDGVAYLDGLVESEAQRDAATDLSLRVEGIARVQNDLEIEEFGQPGDATRPDEQIHGDISYQMLERDRQENRDPFQEPTEQDFNEPVPLVGSDVTSSTMIAAEEGIPYVPPTDPVVRPSTDEQTIAVVGGFGTASDEEFPDRLATTDLGDAPPGDEDLRDEVLQALRADAATTDLVIAVTVRNGRVFLRGEVPSLDDAESAEEVAGRVPGIREVIEELSVTALG